MENNVNIRMEMMNRTLIQLAMFAFTAIPLFAFAAAGTAYAADVTFELVVNGPEGIAFGFALLKDDATMFQSEYTTSASPVKVSVDSGVVESSNRFCLFVNPETSHFEDQSGGKFPATCDALPAGKLPAGVVINYVTTLHAGS